MIGMGNLPWHNLSASDSICFINISVLADLDLIVTELDSKSNVEPSSDISEITAGTAIGGRIISISPKSTRIPTFGNNDMDSGDNVLSHLISNEVYL
jgi:hypothetical protein